MVISKLFAESESVPLAAPTIFHIGNFPITNAMFMGVLVALFIIVVFGAMAFYVKVRPNSKFAFFMETVTMFVLDQVKNNLNGNEKQARKFLPLFLALFTFILLNNLGGLLPATGGTFYLTVEGVKTALIRPFTTDLNGTLALAAITIITVQIFAIKERGLLGHLKHYFLMLDPWWNPMNLFIGLVEVMTEFVRLLTLAMRLFGVIYAGEVLLHVITGLTGNVSFIATVPIIFLEIFFSLIQAYLFIMLSSVYLSLGLSHDDHEKAEHQTVPAADLKVSGQKS